MRLQKTSLDKDVPIFPKEIKVHVKNEPVEIKKITPTTSKVSLNQKIKLKYAAFLEILAKILNFLRRVETVVILINILVLVVIVPWQNNLTRHHEEVYSTYKDIRDALTHLRTNDEGIHDLCNHSTQFAQKDFHKKVISLRDERIKLIINLTVSATDMEQLFNKESYQRVRMFIQWNDSLNDAYFKVCSAGLKNREQLLIEQKKTLTEMKKSL